MMTSLHNKGNNRFSPARITATSAAFIFEIFVSYTLIRIGGCEALQG